MIQCKVCGWEYAPDDWENGRVIVPRHSFPACPGGGVPVGLAERIKGWFTKLTYARCLGVMVAIWGVIWMFFSDIFPVAVAFSMVGAAIVLLSYAIEDR